MSRRTNITTDSASQTQAGSETGAATSGAVNLTGSNLGTRATLNLTQITTDAGVIQAAKEAGEGLLRAQGEVARQSTALGLASLESTKAISENLLSRAATATAAEPTTEAQNARTQRIALAALAAVAAVYFITRR